MSGMVYTYRWINIFFLFVGFSFKGTINQIITQNITWAQPSAEPNHVRVSQPVRPNIFQGQSNVEPKYENIFFLQISQRCFFFNQVRDVFPMNKSEIFLSQYDIEREVGSPFQMHFYFELTSLGYDGIFSKKIY